MPVQMAREVQKIITALQANPYRFRSEHFLPVPSIANALAACDAAIKVCLFKSSSLLIPKFFDEALVVVILCRYPCGLAVSVSKSWLSLCSSRSIDSSFSLLEVSKSPPVVFADRAFHAGS